MMLESVGQPTIFRVFDVLIIIIIKYLTKTVYKKYLAGIKTIHSYQLSDKYLIRTPLIQDLKPESQWIPNLCTAYISSILAHYPHRYIWCSHQGLLSKGFVIHL